MCFRTPYLFAILFAIGIYAVVGESSPDLGDVVFVNILYRHGDRTPIDPYPNDPYRNLSYWPTGWGQLTKDGVMGHYELGKWLRQRYAKLLPEEYDRCDIYVQSTDVDRTLMSAYSNLAGLYEPNPPNNWDPDIKWRPIPVHTVPEFDDMVLSGKKHCSKYIREKNALLSNEYFTRLLSDVANLLETMTNATGCLVNSLESVEYVYNTLTIENKFKFPLPQWTNTIYPEPMKSLADLSFSVACYTPQLARLKSGPLVREMLTNMEKKAAGKLDPDRKAWMYSAHDTTVANLLQALGVFNKISPSYFSTVLLELRKKNDNYFVTIYYRNSTLQEPYLLTLPGCSSLCPLEEFSKIVQPIVPEDWDKECELTMLEKAFDFTGLGIITYAGISSVLLLLLAITFQLCRKRNPESKDFAYQSLSLEVS